LRLVVPFHLVLELLGYYMKMQGNWVFQFPMHCGHDEVSNNSITSKLLFGGYS